VKTTTHISLDVELEIEFDRTIDRDQRGLRDASISIDTITPRCGGYYMEIPPIILAEYEDQIIAECMLAEDTE